MRQAEAKPKRGRRKRGARNQENVVSDEELGEQRDMQSMSMPVVYAIPMGAGQYGSEQLMQGSLPRDLPLPMPAPPPATNMHAPGGGPLDGASVRKSPAEEEMEDGEEDPDFANVRVGNEPPPTWGKRKATEELEGEGSNKKPKSKYVSKQGIFCHN